METSIFRIMVLALGNSGGEGDLNRFVPYMDGRAMTRAPVKTKKKKKKKKKKKRGRAPPVCLLSSFVKAGEGRMRGDLKRLFVACGASKCA